MSNSVRPHRRQPTRLPRPWDSPGKNIGVRCHFLLQCMKVKSESEVAQSCPTLCNPMHCSPPGSSVHGIFQARVLEWGAIAFSERIGHNLATEQQTQQISVEYIDIAAVAQLLGGLQFFVTPGTGLHYLPEFNQTHVGLACQE